MHKTTGEGWNPYILFIFGANHAVLHAHNDRWCLGPLEIYYSVPKVAVLNAKPTDKGWDP